MKIKRLPEAELDVMLVIWKLNPPITSTEVFDKLKNRDWPLPTLMTVMSRLVKKGFLKCEKDGRNNMYYALIEEEDYKQAEASTIIKTLYRNSFKNFVATFYNGKKLSNKDINELRDFLDELEKENQK